MPTFKTLSGALEWLGNELDRDVPIHEILCDSWRNKYSEVDLIITDKGPVESHDMLYDGKTIEITITTRKYTREEDRARFE